jgi:hypothetical protein
MKLTTSLVPSLQMIIVASLVPFLLLSVLSDMGTFSCYATVPYPGDPCYNYEPEFPELGRIACYDQTGQQICCNESPELDNGNGSTYGGADSGLDSAALGAIVAGFIAAAAAIGIAATKGGWGKASSKGTQKDSFTKSALQSYKSDFTKKYSGRPPWMHPETNTYGYEAAKSAETSPSHVMKPEDFDLRRIEGVGITNPPSSNPPPRNVTYKRTANSVNLRWNPPTVHDASTGNVFQGYDVYYQERTTTSTDWVTRHIAVPGTQNGITIQNPSLQSQNFGVRVVYKTPDGSIFYSDGILGTINGG